MMSEPPIRTKRSKTCFSGGDRIEQTHISEDNYLVFKQFRAVSIINIFRPVDIFNKEIISVIIIYSVGGVAV